MKRVLVLVGLFGIAAALSSCSDNGERQLLVLTGSSTIAPLASEVGKRFEKLNPGVRVDVQTGGSSRGIADVRQGAADIGMASRSLKKEEADLFAFTIALDGICVVLHQDNQVSALTDKQIVAIYTGQITNWNEVGGRDASIVVANKAEGRATLEVFLKYFKLKNSQVKAQSIVGDNEQGIKFISGNSDAIGYVSIGTAEYGEMHGAPIKILSIAGVAASTENVRNGSFPMSRSLNLITRAQPEGLIKKFLDFAQSREVHDLVRNQYFVPISE